MPERLDLRTRVPLLPIGRRGPGSKVSLVAETLSKVPVNP